MANSNRQAPKPPAPDESEAPAVELVKMFRNGQFADVHPDEVRNYKKGDWRVYVEGMENETDED